MVNGKGVTFIIGLCVSLTLLVGFAITMGDRLYAEKQEILVIRMQQELITKRLERLEEMNKLLEEFRSEIREYRKEMADQRKGK